MLNCPHCEKKVDSSLSHCPFCQTPLHDEAAKQVYQQRIIQSTQERQELNKRSAKVQLVWLVIFAIVIAGLFWWKS